MEHQKKVMHLAMCLLPKANRDVLEVLLLFFKDLGEFAIRQDGSNGSLMDINNISTVIAPNILYNKTKESVKEDSLLAIQSITSMLIWQDEFYMIPVEINALMTESTEGMSDKDLLKKCEIIVKNTKQTEQVGIKKEFNNNVENKLVIFDDNPAKNSSATISET